MKKTKTKIKIRHQKQLEPKEGAEGLNWNLLVLNQK